MWSGKYLVDALKFLYENDHREFRIEGEGEDERYLMSFLRPPLPGKT